MGDTPVYLDYAATTPLSVEAERAMKPFWQDQFYNPSALYGAADQTRQVVETARTQIARWLGAQAHQLIFTSGATESNNLVIQSILSQFPEGRILTSAIEHASVRVPAAVYDHTAVKVDSSGTLDMQDLERQLDDRVVLVSIIHASNELGTVQPIARIAKLLAKVRLERSRRKVKLPLLLHIDAAQTANCLDLHVSRLGVDFLTLSAHKCYGPKGIGALYAKNTQLLTAMQSGGGQERGLRSGTQAVPLIVGFATAFESAQSHRSETVADLTAKRTLLLDELSTLPGVTLNAPAAKQFLPNIVNFSAKGYDGERLVLELDKHGFQVATGAACSAGSEEPSHVLRAIGLSRRAAQSSLRLSFGKATTNQQLKQFVRAFAGLIQ